MNERNTPRWKCYYLIMDKAVDAYINKHKSPQKEILISLRKLIHKTIPGIHEEMRFGVPWYEGKYYIAAMRKQVNFGFAFNGMLEKYKDELEGNGQYMRHIKIYSLDDINEKLLVKLMKDVKEGYVDPHPKKR